MPFKSKSQNRACWAKYNRDIKQGKTPTWNCHEFAQETDYASLPEKVSSNLPSGTVFDAVKNNKFNDFMEFLNDSKFDPNAEYVHPEGERRRRGIMDTLLVTCVLLTRLHGEEYVKELLKKKPDLNVLDHGQTALMIAAEHSNGESTENTVKLLIDAGADINLQNEYGNTALMSAAEHSNGHYSTYTKKNVGGTENTVRLLIAAGAKLDLKNEDGRTALQIAADDYESSSKWTARSTWGTIKMLIDAGAEIPQDHYIEGLSRHDPQILQEYSKLRQYKIDSLQKQLADYTEILDDLERQYLSELTECQDIQDSNEGIKLLEKCVEEAKKMAETKPEYKKLVKEYENIMVKKAELPSGEIKKDLLTLSEKDLEIMFKYYKVDNIDDLIEKIYL